MQKSRTFFYGLAVFLVLCSASLWAEGVTLTDGEFQALKTALMLADEQLTESEQEISNLQSLLKTQDGLLLDLKTELDKSLSLCNEQQAQLLMLTGQLETASTSLQKLKNEQTGKTIKMILAGVACLVVGGAVGVLIAR